MIKTLILLVVLCAGFSQVSMASEPAAAEDPNKQFRDNKTLKLLCSETVAHVPQDDVEYQGGIDQEGNFIVAADSGTTFSAFEYPIDIPLQLDILEKFNLDVPVGIIADAKIAGIKVHEDGHVEYNGQDISPQVSSFCKEKMAEPVSHEKGHEPEIEKEDLGAPIAGEGH